MNTITQLLKRILTPDSSAGATPQPPPPLIEPMETRLLMSATMLAQDHTPDPNPTRHEITEHVSFTYQKIIW
jgi:hypothetical protein